MTAPTLAQPEQSAIARPSRQRWLKPGAWTAFGKTTAVAAVALAAPFSAWGSLTVTWAHLVWLIGGRNHGSPGAHAVAGAVCVAAVGLAWTIDPGTAADTGKRRLRIATKHFISRILRWAATCGSLLYIPVAAGIIHLTTGAH